MRCGAFQLRAPSAFFIGRLEAALEPLSHTTRRLSRRRQHRNQVLNEALSRLTSSEPYPVHNGNPGSLSVSAAASAGGGTAGLPAIPRLMDRGRELAVSLGGERFVFGVVYTTFSCLMVSFSLSYCSGCAWFS